MELSTDTYRLRDQLRALHETFLMTAYGCRLAIADTQNIISFTPNAFPEIEGALNVLQTTRQQWSSGSTETLPPDPSTPLFDRTCYQTSLSAIDELRSNRKNDPDDPNLTKWSNFQNLVPDENYPLELAPVIESWPTFWVFGQGQDNVRIVEMLNTSRALTKKASLPPLQSLFHLGHFSCAAVRVTDNLLQKIS